MFNDVMRALRPSALALLYFLALPMPGGAVTLPAYGWSPLDGTQMRPLCPPDNYKGSGYAFKHFCRGVIGAWSSGALDPERNRLYLWGGGHNDYYGNEIYALDLNAFAMLRLNDPVLPLADRAAPVQQSELAPFDGTQPNSRHTYGGMAFMPNHGLMWVFSGSLSHGSGGYDNLTWVFDPATNEWTRLNPTGDIPNGTLGHVSAYDPVTGKIFLHNRKGLYTFEYTPEGGVYTLLSETTLGGGMSAAIDPERRLLVIIGNERSWYYDLSEGSTYRRNEFGAEGARELITAPYPGIAYDPVGKQMVAWAGGDRVYYLDFEARRWNVVSHQGGPGPQAENGTFGRWAYVPALDAFVIVNDVDQNAYLFHPPRGISDTRAPSVPGRPSAVDVRPYHVEISWQGASDDFGVDHYQVLRDGAEISNTERTEFKDLAVTPGTMHSYAVVAVDSAGNASTRSPLLSVAVPARTVDLPLGDCSSEPSLKGRGDVVFCEPWESPNWWASGYRMDGGTTRVVPADANRVRFTEIVQEGCVSGNCLKVNMPKGQSGSLSVFWPMEEAQLAPEKLYLRYFLKLADNWRPSMCNSDGSLYGYGGKFPGLADVRTGSDPAGQCGNGGASSDGINCWSMRTGFASCLSNDGKACASKPNAVTRIGSYLYHPQQPDSTGSAGQWDGHYWGQTTGDGGTCDTTQNNLYCGTGDGGVLETGRWYRVETEVQMNTPGKADGVIRAWVDGVLSYEKVNVMFRFRDHDGLHARQVWLDVYKGGTKGNCDDTAIFLDQMVVTKDAPVGGDGLATKLPPYLNLAADTRSVGRNGSATISWQTDNATSCQASGNWSGAKPLSGSETVGPLTAPAVLTLTCEGPNGVVDRSVDVTVQDSSAPVGGGTGAPVVEVQPTEPSAPLFLRAEFSEDAGLRIDWDASSDDVGVAGYEVYSGTALLGKVVETGYVIAQPLLAQSYRITVRAFDGDGNFSGYSPVLAWDTEEVSKGATPSTRVVLKPSADLFLHNSTVKNLGKEQHMTVSDLSTVMLKFGLEGVTQNAEVKSAVLRLYDFAKYGTIDAMGVFRLDKPWTEYVATPDYYDVDRRLRWTQRLGDWLDMDGVRLGGNAYSSATLIDDDRPTWVELDVTNLVREWVSGSAPNHGLLLRNVSGYGSHAFRSKEYTDHTLAPQLVVEFSTRAKYVVGPAADALVHTSTVSNLGVIEKMEISGISNSLLRFEMPAELTSESVQTAVLRVFNYAKFNTATISVFRAGKPWGERSTSRIYADQLRGVVWDNELGDWEDALHAAQGPVSYATVTVPDDDRPSWVEFDVTGLVKEWARGDGDNFGMLLASDPEHPSASFIFSREYQQLEYRPHLLIDAVQ